MSECFSEGGLGQCLTSSACVCGTPLAPCQARVQKEVASCRLAAGAPAWCPRLTALFAAPADADAGADACAGAHACMLACIHACLCVCACACRMAHAYGPLDECAHALWVEMAGAIALDMFEGINCLHDHGLVHR